MLTYGDSSMETVFVGLVIVYTLQMSHQDIRIYLPMRIRSTNVQLIIIL